MLRKRKTLFYSQSNGPKVMPTLCQSLSPICPRSISSGSTMLRPSTPLPLLHQPCPYSKITHHLFQTSFEFWYRRHLPRLRLGAGSDLAWLLGQASFTLVPWYSRYLQSARMTFLVKLIVYLPCLRKSRMGNVPLVAVASNTPNFYDRVTRKRQNPRLTRCLRSPSQRSIK
jgi:hypothetical protein